MLLKFGGKLTPVFKLLLNISVALNNSEVGNETLGKEVEFELCGDKEEAKEEVLVGTVNKEETVLPDERVSDDTVYWA